MTALQSTSAWADLLGLVSYIMQLRLRGASVTDKAYPQSLLVVTCPVRLDLTISETEG